MNPSPLRGTSLEKGRNYNDELIMKTPERILEISRKLRKNMTETELILWKVIKGGKIGGRFMRQKPIYVFSDETGLERYIIPDFVCFNYKIIIEIDGSIHDIKEVYELDLYKEKLLKGHGYVVLRFTNQEIRYNLSNVIKIIKQHLTHRLSGTSLEKGRN